MVQPVFIDNTLETLSFIWTATTFCMNQFHRTLIVNGNFNKFISGPLFRKLEEEGHIFDLNTVWEALFSNLDALTKNASMLMEGSIDF